MANMITEEQIRTIVTEYYTESDKFPVEIHVRPTNRITVFIDGDHGITIADCQNLTRHLESTLDREQEDFDLTVSSAGADKPMRIPRQFLRHTGRTLEITTTDGEVISGKLVNADNEGLELEHQTVKKELPKPNTRLTYAKIREGRIVLAFR